MYRVSGRRFSMLISLVFIFAASTAIATTISTPSTTITTTAIATTITTSATACTYTADAGTAVPIGMVYKYSPSHSRDSVLRMLRDLNVTSLLIQDPNPYMVGWFSHTNISIYLSLPNNEIQSFTKPAYSRNWVKSHIVDHASMVKFNGLSIGSNVNTSIPSFVADVGCAVKNAYRNLKTYKIRLQVGVSFDFHKIISMPYLPSSAVFSHPNEMMKFMDIFVEFKSPLYVNIFPHLILTPQYPLGFALFQDSEDVYRFDLVSGIRYRSLFDMIVDAIFAAIGNTKVPVLITATGWPSCKLETNHSKIYLQSLIDHIRSGNGTRPLKDGRVIGLYIRELIDSKPVGLERWGVFDENTTLKFQLDFCKGCTQTEDHYFSTPFTIVWSVSLFLSILFASVIVTSILPALDANLDD